MVMKRLARRGLPWISIFFSHLGGSLFFHCRSSRGWADSATGIPRISREGQTPCFGLMTTDCCFEMGTCRALRDRGRECAYGPSRERVVGFS